MPLGHYADVCALNEGETLQYATGSKKAEAKTTSTQPISRRRLPAFRRLRRLAGRIGACMRCGDRLRRCGAYPLAAQLAQLARRGVADLDASQRVVGRAAGSGRAGAGARGARRPGATARGGTTARRLKAERGRHRPGAAARGALALTPSYIRRTSYYMMNTRHCGEVYFRVLFLSLWRYRSIIIAHTPTPAAKNSYKTLRQGSNLRKIALHHSR